MLVDMNPQDYVNSLKHLFHNCRLGCYGISLTVEADIADLELA